MRLYPININPYINLLRYSNLDDRLEYAFKFIDEVIDIFSRYGQKGNAGHDLTGIIKQGFKEWKKLVRYDILVHIDEEGEEYTLDAQAYPDYLLSRFLGTAETEADLKEMNKTMRAIYKHLGFKFTEQE